MPLKPIKMFKKTPTCNITAKGGSNGGTYSVGCSMPVSSTFDVSAGTSGTFTGGGSFHTGSSGGCVNYHPTPTTTITGCGGTGGGSIGFGFNF